MYNMNRNWGLDPHVKLRLPQTETARVNVVIGVSYTLIHSMQSVLQSQIVHGDKPAESPSP